MPKKKILILLILCLVLVGINGCNFLTHRVITLNLAGFPTSPTLYNITVITYDKNDEAINTFTFTDVVPNSLLTRKVTIQRNAEVVMIFLNRESETTPAFFTGFKLGTKQTYNLGYWVDYYKYVNGVIDYGISEYFVQELNFDSCAIVDFSYAPYFIFKVSGVQNKDIIIRYTDDWGIKIGYYGTIPLTGNWDIGSGSTYMLENWEQANIYVVVKPDYDHIEFIPKGTLSVGGDNIDWLPTSFIKVLPGETPNRFFALDISEGVHVIDPIQKSLVKTIKTPMAGPDSFAYSAIDKKVYVNWDNRIGCIDVETDSSMVFELDINIVDIAVSPKMRKMYVFGTPYDDTSSWLYVVDMDTHIVLTKTQITSGGSVHFNEITKKLYTVHWDFATEVFTLYRYSVENDTPIMEEKKVMPNYCKNIQYTADGSKIFYAYTDEYSKTSVAVFDALNFNNKIGQWNAAGEVACFTLNPNGSLLYVTQFDKNDNYVHVVDMNNYKECGKIVFPKNCGGGFIIANSDGSMLLGADGSFIHYISTTLNTAVNSNMTIFDAMDVQEIKGLAEYIKVDGKK